MPLRAEGPSELRIACFALLARRPSRSLSGRRTHSVSGSWNPSQNDSASSWVVRQSLPSGCGRGVPGGLWWRQSPTSFPPRVHQGTASGAGRPMLWQASAALDGSQQQYRANEEYRKQQDDCCCQNNRPAERAGTIMTRRQCREGPQVQRGHGLSISEEL